MCIYNINIYIYINTHKYKYIYIYINKTWPAITYFMYISLHIFVSGSQDTSA